MIHSKRGFVGGGALPILVLFLPVSRVAWGADKTNIVILMTDDTGWNDFGAYSGGGAGLGHPTPKSIGLPKRARPSPTGTARPAALRAARRSSRAEFPSARHSRSWSLRAMRESPPQGDSYYCRIF